MIALILQDATREFVDGDLECVTIMVGIAFKGHSIAGVLVQPFVDQDGLIYVKPEKPKEKGKEGMSVPVTFLKRKVGEGKLFFGIKGEDGHQGFYFPPSKETNHATIIHSQSHVDVVLVNAVKALKEVAAAHFKDVHEISTGGAGHKSMVLPFILCKLLT